MQDHWNLGRIGGIPVSLHWTTLLAFPWLFLWMRDLLGAAIGTVAFVAVQMVHELGHVAAARWRGVAVYSIELAGLHGETERGHARSARDEVLIAWGGVLAQLVLLAAALGLMPLLGRIGQPLVWAIAGPVFAVWTQWNIFLMVVALLPIGPMDGHLAWRVLPMARDLFRRRGRSGKVVKLSAARRRALAAESERKTAEILERYRRK